MISFFPSKVREKAQAWTSREAEEWPHFLDAPVKRLVQVAYLAGDMRRAYHGVGRNDLVLGVVYRLREMQSITKEFVRGVLHGVDPMVALVKCAREEAAMATKRAKKLPPSLDYSKSDRPNRRTLPPEYDTRNKRFRALQDALHVSQLARDVPGASPFRLGVPIAGDRLSRTATAFVSGTVYEDYAVELWRAVRAESQGCTRRLTQRADTDDGAIQ